MKTNGIRLEYTHSLIFKPRKYTSHKCTAINVIYPPPYAQFLILCVNTAQSQKVPRKFNDF